MIIRSIETILAGRAFHTTSPEKTVRAACLHLDAANVGALAVVTAGRLAGVLSERDVIRKCLALGRRTDDTTVADIMTPDPVTIDAGAPLAEAMGAMVMGGFRHLPVMRNGAAVGMLSMRDIPTEYRLMFERFQEYAARPTSMGGEQMAAQ